MIVVAAVLSVLASLLMSVTERRPAGLLRSSIRGCTVSMSVRLSWCRRFTESLFICPFVLCGCSRLSRESLTVLDLSKAFLDISVLMRAVHILSVSCLGGRAALRRRKFKCAS